MDAHSCPSSFLPLSSSSPLPFSPLPRIPSLPYHPLPPPLEVVLVDGRVPKSRLPYCTLICSYISHGITLLIITPYLEVVLVYGHLKVQSSELTQVTVRVAVLSPASTQTHGAVVSTCNIPGALIHHVMPL